MKYTGVATMANLTQAFREQRVPELLPGPTDLRAIRAPENVVWPNKYFP